MANDGFARPSSAETLYIDRIRRGETQRQAARRLKVSLALYGAMELGKTEARRVPIGKLTANERCVLQRKRVGSTQLQVAQDLGVCRWWVNQMESGRQDCTALSSYWDA
jgi:DNA-binding XRE family transcriptional regulator